MRRIVIPDTGPLGKITDSKLEPNVKRLINFIAEQKIFIKIAEINDYELRRNYLLSNLTKSLNRLNKYRRTNQFLPITSEVMLEAAELWAEVRRKGQSTADNKTLDGDVILAAQAISQTDLFDEVIILTENTKHLVRFCEYGIYIWDWKQALIDCIYKEINYYQPELKDLL